jgi:GDSL-like Lipase/Acylhydrolase family/von Willebrand factor type A domain
MLHRAGGNRRRSTWVRRFGVVAAAGALLLGPTAGAALGGTRLAAPTSLATTIPAGGEPASYATPGSSPTPHSRTGTGQAVPGPLLVVLDSSGSMGDDDGKGVVKLEGAQASLINLVRRLPLGAPMGLWTYPAGSSNCSPGALSVPVGPLDSVSMSAKIRSLKAGGDTPTAEALRAAVASLQAAGYDGGTVLLVSDGESTCEPPCDVAKELAGSGFDLTVQALGFRISATGADELSCIADATGGTYSSVDNSAALQDMLVAAARPALDLTVDADDTVPPSTRTTLTATVRNTSALVAHNVTAALSFTATGLRDEGGSTFTAPEVAVPRLLLGNIPPGQQIQRSWTLSTGQPAAVKHAAIWKVVSTSTDSAAVTKQGSMVFLTAALGMPDAGPILQDVSSHGGRIAILGDSFSAGEGAKRYFDESNRAKNRCHRSPLTYAMSLFDDKHKPHLIACSGAVIADFYEPKASDDGETAQIAHLHVLDPAPEEVLMTVGGNDIGFAGIIEACVQLGDCAKDAVPQPDAFSRCQMVDGILYGLNCYTTRAVDVMAKVAAQRPTLTKVYEDVAATLNSSTLRGRRGGRVGQVLVLAYPQMFPNQRAGCTGLSAADVAFGNDVVDALNTVVRAAVGDVRQAGYPVQLVEDVRDSFLPNHTACDKEPWANPFSYVTGIRGKVPGVNAEKELLHPKPAGYAAMTSALVQWSQRATTAPLTAHIPDDLTVRTSDGGDPIDAVDLQGADGSVVQGGVGAPSGSSPGVQGSVPPKVSLSAGEALTVRADGFAAGTPVTVTVRSAPRALATATADDDGHVVVAVTLPAALVQGKHVLTAEGMSSTGAPRTAFASLDVQASLPWWVRPLEGTSGLAVVIGVTLSVRSVVKRRRNEEGQPAKGHPDKPSAAQQ